jgi:hypothetical protein
MDKIQTLLSPGENIYNLILLKRIVQSNPITRIKTFTSQDFCFLEFSFKNKETSERGECLTASPNGLKHRYTKRPLIRNFLVQISTESTVAKIYYRYLSVPTGVVSSEGRLQPHSNSISSPHTLQSYGLTVLYKKHVNKIMRFVL